MIPPFEIFGKTFAIYPLIALAGFFVSGIFACVQIKKRGFDENDMICVLLFCGVGALIGGHMLYGLTNPTLFFQTFSMLPQTAFPRLLAVGGRLPSAVPSFTAAFSAGWSQADCTIGKSGSPTILWM